MLTASEVLSTIRSQMATYANVYRTEANLLQLLNCLTQLEQRYCPLEYQAYQGIEIYHALKAAQSVVKAMLSRKVSLGAHYIVLCMLFFQQVLKNGLRKRFLFL